MKRKAVAQEDSLWSDKQVIYTFQGTGNTLMTMVGHHPHK